MWGSSVEAPVSHARTTVWLSCAVLKNQLCKSIYVQTLLKTVPQVVHLHVQAAVASWDSICPDMKELIFAPLSLRDLGRAAPTSRDFRAAYKARLSAANPAAVAEAVSWFGEAFLRTHATLILRLFSGVDPFSGSEGAEEHSLFHILASDGTLGRGWAQRNTRQHLSQNTRVGSGSFEYIADYRRIRSPTLHPQPEFCSFELACDYRAGDYMFIHVLCRIAHCWKVAGAIGAICEYLLADPEWSARQEECDARQIVVRFPFKCTPGEKVANGNWSGTQVHDIAAATLPLTQLYKSLSFWVSRPGHERVVSNARLERAANQCGSAIGPGAGSAILPLTQLFQLWICGLNDQAMDVCVSWARGLVISQLILLHAL